jgi:lipopolysaccharide/colanic/teichoic acid biosynthesis glycosyltransferase
VLIFDVSFWRRFLILFFLLPSTLLLIWRRFYFFIFKYIPTVKKVIFLYESSLGANYDLDKKENTINGLGLETHYEVVYKQDLSVNTTTIPLESIFEDDEKIDAWVIDVDLSKRLPKLLEEQMLDALVKGAEVLTLTSFYSNVYEALPIISHNANESCAEILQLQHNRVRYLTVIFSFAVNIFLSLFVGVLLLMVIPFVFLLNIFFNPGPLFYTQKRVGQYGNEFNIYKFRSMIVDAEKTGAKMAKKNDVRITPFGKILRMFRLDELPQIISVIRGDMLFIGPRPERKVFVDKLNEILPFYHLRHLIKPGITGWAQVKYKYGENLDDSIKKLEYDLYYVKNKTIGLDLRIIFKTFTTIIFSKGI